MSPDACKIGRSDRLPIYVVDDDSEFRRSLMLLLAEHGWGTTGFNDAESLLEALSHLAPGIVLTDVRLPTVSGVTLIRLLIERHRRDAVVVMTAHADVGLAVEAMKAGAIEFLEKPFPSETLLAALATTARLAPMMDTADVHERIASLSARELEVLRYLIGGATNKRVAIGLGISPRTVDVYRAKLMIKMRAESLPQLVLLAVAGGISPGSTH